jgi:superfamily II DNA or RNA helicase
MASFQTFLDSFDSESSKKGKQFEYFVKWFLTNDPEWSTIVDKVWLWDDWLENWGRDCGIDLIFKQKITGEIWAVQAKCYDSNYSITKKDVDSFLSESSRPQIDKRLLIATTNIIGANAKKVCNETDKQVVRHLLYDFEESAIEYPKTLPEIVSAKVKELPRPRKYQERAIEDVMNGFSHSDRGQLIMACGTGKTLTTLWIKEALRSNTTLVLMPSLTLLSQTLKEWTANKNTYFNALCVCSDAAIGKREYDAIIGAIEDLSFPSTSDPAEILKFLEYSGDKVIFSTYQSSPVVAEAQSKSSIQFDLVIADEAHRCTGELGKAFTTILDQSKIKAKKRLFTTATPRTYSANLKTMASKRGVEILGMDDEPLFGSVFHTLSFSSAINNKPPLLTDYQVVIMGVDKPMIAKWIKDREFIRTSKGKTTNAKALAAQLGLIKAIKDYDLKRLISFHSRVESAKSFALEIHDAIDAVCDEYKPNGVIWSDFVSGKMPTKNRSLKLKQLKELTSCEFGILSNARCLAEGVDVPSLDGVAFIDPKSSQIDIVQAVGRAIRLNVNKSIGTIILPIFIENDDNEVVAIESSNFRPIWNIINALRAHDSELSFELDQLRTQMGIEGSSKVRKISDKIIFDLPQTVDASFSESLKTIIVERTTIPWNFWFGLLIKYVEINGDALVGKKFIVDDKFNLGSWVVSQRNLKKNNILKKDRIKKLESLSGWSWIPFDDYWNKGFGYLKAYVKKYGHASVERKCIVDDKFNLGSWVFTQRSFKKNNKLTKYRIKKLESLSGWSWAQNSDRRWNKSFEYLKAYVKKNGHARVINRFKTDDGFHLGAWVTSQRKQKSSKADTKLTKYRIKKLESLSGWSWAPLDDDWNEGFEYLKAYVKKNGNAKVFSRFKTDDGFTLGIWVGSQRRSKKRNTLTKDHIQKLESLTGWYWEIID